MYYQSVWKGTKLENQTRALALDTVLLFDMDDSRHSSFKERLSSEVILVTPGDCYQESSPQKYSVNPRRPADYQKLLAALSRQNAGLPGHIIHLWSQAPFVNDKLNIQLDMSLFSVFHLSQAIFAQKPSSRIQLLYIYLETDEARQPQYAALSGFAKTVRLENPRFNCKTIAVQTLDKVADIVSAEFQVSDGVEIRYDDSRRQVRHLQEFDGAADAQAATLLKENGVYLITGGAGGLGLIFAEYLVRHFKARLVLTGRSSLNEEQTGKIKRLNELDASVIYLPADISNSEDVVSLIAQTKSRFNEINGIIHSAGVIKDALILKKTPDEMTAVLAPKVHGTIYLDEAARNEPLDFFVLFSSAVAVLGNAGQCDYAYANSFMDNFAAKREEQRAAQKRSGKTLSINWPLWQSGGMHVDEQTKKRLADTLGIRAISTETGIEAFSRGLCSER
ncbi:MAG: SDR family NAD(P)-dependent oxidoreductase, partial [Gammaproteobacteria bacterium]|nr:SDR family NAD(P)-dependent oxidoreductase [Gammaproteobacteria bacterium]